jgi:hypothetical protein
MTPDEAMQAFDAVQAGGMSIAFDIKAGLWTATGADGVTSTAPTPSAALAALAPVPAGIKPNPAALAASQAAEAARQVRFMARRSLLSALPAGLAPEQLTVCAARIDAVLATI